jgi:hypothetical protein
MIVVSHASDDSGLTCVFVFFRRVHLRIFQPRMSSCISPAGLRRNGIREIRARYPNHDPELNAVVDGQYLVHDGRQGMINQVRLHVFSFLVALLGGSPWWLSLVALLGGSPWWLYRSSFLSFSFALRLFSVLSFSPIVSFLILIAITFSCALGHSNVPFFCSSACHFFLTRRPQTHRLPGCWKALVGRRA